MWGLGFLGYYIDFEKYTRNHCGERFLPVFDRFRVESAVRNFV